MENKDRNKSDDYGRKLNVTWEHLIFGEIMVRKYYY
jgi:hypothetical protein